MDNNININFAPFYVGQKVVYITGNNMKKDSVHTVLGCYKRFCGKCWEVEIERKPPTSNNYDSEDFKRATHVACEICLTWVKKDDFIRVKIEGLWNATSFRPVQEAKMVRVELTKIMEEVPVLAN